MNLWKRLITGTMIFVMAAVLSAGWDSVTAAASDAWTATGTLLDDEKNSINVDYASEKLYVYTEAEEVMLCVPTVKMSGGTVKKITEKTYDVYQTEYDGSRTYCEIDLSTLNKKKVSYVMIKTSAYDTPLLIQFKATTQSLKGTYDLTSQTVSFQGKESANTEKGKVEAETMAYRTANQIYSTQYYPCWEEENSNIADLTQYQQTGATLYFRQMGGYTLRNYASKEIIGFSSYEEMNRESEEGATTTVEPTAQKGVSYTMVTGLGVFPSAEVKVKITKRASGPSVFIDYRNRTATVKKRAEYRDGSGVDSAVSSDGWIQVQGAAYKVPFDEIASGILEVRTSPTYKDTAGTIKKQASKITRCVLSGIVNAK